MIIEDEIIGSQTDAEDHDDSDDSTDEVLALFGVEKKTEIVDDKPPAKEEVKTESKKLTIKYNKEDIEVDDKDIPSLVEKGMNLDKVRGQKTELEKNLDRAAKLAGYKDHTEYVANFDKIEQEQKQKVEDAYTQLRKDLRAEATENGLDPDKVEAYLDNHPLMKEALQAKTDRDIEREAHKIETEQKAVTEKWNALYAKYPDIVEDSNGFKTGDPVKFYTPEMQARIERGYDPIDAYELSHRDKLTAQTKKKTEQQVIKEQQLGLRSRVETNTQTDNEPQVPADLANAFAAFGLPAESAKKYVK